MLRMRIDPPVIIHCLKPNCPFSAVARTDGRALNALANHLIEVHHAVEAGHDHV